MLKPLVQGCTNVGRQVAVATEFCGTSAWNLLHVILIAPRNLRSFLDFFLKKFVCPCISSIFANFRCERPKKNTFYSNRAPKCDLDASGKLHSVGRVP